MTKIDNKLCEFVGAIIGDGNIWTDGSRFRVELTGDPTLDKHYFEYLSKVAFELFGKKPYTLKIRQRGLRFRLQHKPAFDTLVGLGMKAGYKARNVVIPKPIIKKGWTHIKYTIRGIMDTDGTVFFSKKTYSEAIYPSLEIRTYSRRLGIQINRLLKQNGFRSHFRGNEIRGYCVGIYGIAMVKKWVNDIGFSNDRHVYKYLAHKTILTESAAVTQPGRVSA